MNPEKNKNNNNVEPAPPAKIRNVTAGLDIGTTKICCIVAEHDEKPGSIKILGIGITESKGLNRGVVVNIDKTVKAIQGAVEQAEQQSGPENNRGCGRYSRRPYRVYSLKGNCGNFPK